MYVRLQATQYHLAEVCAIRCGGVVLSSPSPCLSTLRYATLPMYTPHHVQSSYFVATPSTVSCPSALT
jgi:hypothetical protein